MILPHLLGHVIHLAVTAKAGIVTGHIVVCDQDSHIIGQITQFQTAILAGEQQTVTRRVQHRVVGGTFHALEQPLARDHLDLLCHSRQHHRRQH